MRRADAESSNGCARYGTCGRGGGGGGAAARTVPLAALDGKGVTGTATLTDAGNGQTQVVIYRITCTFHATMSMTVTVRP